MDQEIDATDTESQIKKLLESRGVSNIEIPHITEIHRIFHRHDLPEILKRLQNVDPEVIAYAAMLVGNCKTCQTTRNAPYNPPCSDKMLDLNSYGRTNFVWLLDTYHYSLTKRRGRDLTSVAITNQTTNRSISYPRLNIHTPQETVRHAIFEAYCAFLGLPSHIYSDFGGELAMPTASWLTNHGVKIKPRIPYRFQRISQTDVSHRELRTLIYDMYHMFKKYDIEPDLVQLHKLACLYHDARARRRCDGSYLSNLHVHNLLNEVNPILSGTLLVNRDIPITKLMDLRNALYRRCVANTMSNTLLRIGSHKMVKLHVDPHHTKSGTKVLAWYNKTWRVSEFVGASTRDPGVVVITVFGTPKNVIVPTLRRCSQMLELDQEIIIDAKQGRDDFDDAEYILPDDMPIEEFEDDPFAGDPKDGDYIPDIKAPSSIGTSATSKSASLENTELMIGPPANGNNNIIDQGTEQVVHQPGAAASSSSSGSINQGINQVVHQPGAAASSSSSGTIVNTGAMPSTSSTGFGNDLLNTTGVARRDNPARGVKGTNISKKETFAKPVGVRDESESSEFSDEALDSDREKLLRDALKGTKHIESNAKMIPKVKVKSKHLAHTQEWLLDDLELATKEVREELIDRAKSKSNEKRKVGNTRRTRVKTKKDKQKKRRKSGKENAFFSEVICESFYNKDCTVSEDSLKIIKESNGKKLYLDVVDGDVKLKSECPWPDYGDLEEVTKFIPLDDNDDPKELCRQIGKQIDEELCFLTTEHQLGLRELQMASLREYVRSVGIDELSRGKHRLIHRDPFVDKLNNALHGDKVILNNKCNKHLDRVIIEAKIIKDKNKVNFESNKQYFIFDQHYTDIAQVYQAADLEKFTCEKRNGLFLVGCEVEIPAQFDFKKHLGDVKSSAIEVSEEAFKRMQLINTFTPSNEKEIGDLLRYNTLHVTEHQTDEKPEDFMDSRVVFTVKINHRDGVISKCKTRIVVKGFQEFRQNLQRACYTVSDLAFNTILNHAAKHQYVPLNGDVTCAFLQGKEYDDAKQVYIKLPQMVIDLKSNPLNKKFVKLRKSLYGLVDAPSEWQNALFEHLLGHGLQQCDSDPALFRVTAKVLDQFYTQNNEKELISRKYEGAIFKELANSNKNNIQNSDSDIKLLSESIKDDLTHECSSHDLTATSDSTKSEAVMGVHVDDILASASKRAATFLRCVFSTYQTELEELSANVANRFLGRDLFCIPNTGHNRAVASTKKANYSVVDKNGIEKFLEGDELTAYLEKNKYIVENIEFFLITSMDSYQEKIKKLDMDEMNKYHATLQKITARCQGNPYKLKFMTRQLHNPFRGRTGELGWLSKQKPAIMYDTTRFATFNMVSETGYDAKFSEILEDLNKFIDHVHTTTSNNCYFRMKDIPYVGKKSLSCASHEKHESNIVFPSATTSSDVTNDVTIERNVEVLPNNNIKELKFCVKQSHVCAVDAGIDEGAKACLGSCEAMMGSILNDNGVYTPLFHSSDLNNEEKKTLDTSDSFKLMFSNLFCTRSSPKRIVRSSTGAELLGLKAGIHTTLFTRRILLFCGLIDEEDLSYILCDNKNLCHSNRKPPAEKLLLKDHLLVTKLLAKTKLKLLHIPGISNIADILTKGTDRSNVHLATRYFTRGALNQSLKEVFDPRMRGPEKLMQEGENECFLVQKCAIVRNRIGQWVKAPEAFFTRESELKKYYNKEFKILL